MNNHYRKHAIAEDSIYVEDSLLEFDELPDDLVEHAQEYIEALAEGDDMHWHHENVNSWH